MVVNLAGTDDIWRSAHQSAFLTVLLSTSLMQRGNRFSFACALKAMVFTPFFSHFQAAYILSLSSSGLTNIENPHLLHQLATSTP